MKKLFYAITFSVVISSCAKEKIKSENEKISGVFAVLNKKKSTVKDVFFDKSESKYIIDFLDHASPEEAKRIFERLNSQFNASYSKLNLKKNISESSSEQETMQLFSEIEVFNQYAYDMYADLQLGSGWWLTYNYKWTMATIGYPFVVGTVVSNERVVVADAGSEYAPHGVRYPIQSFQHQSSYLTGFTALLTYQETSHYDYPGIYNFATSTTGNVGFLGINREVSSSRFANTTRMVESMGKAVNQF